LPLIRALLESYPDYQIVLTSTTPTGAAQAAKHFGSQLLSFYTPYDLPGSVKRFLKRIHPHLGIILETELWPNLLAACCCQRIPLLLANARLSARSLRGYRRIAPLAQQMINSFTLVATQAPADGERFLALGLLPEKLQVTGNLKFDIALAPDLKTQREDLRKEWGATRPVWIAASTHEGEEKIILAALNSIRSQFPSILLILVPRHPQRFSKVRQLCQQTGLTIAIRSEKQTASFETSILFADTIGELMKFYAAADLAFVGGSITPLGGHNLIEPAVLGVPVLTGPHLHNFADISQSLLQAGGAKIVHDEKSMSAAVIKLLQDAEARASMGNSAREVILKNTGALAKHLACIKTILKK